MLHAAVQLQQHLSVSEKLAQSKVPRGLEQSTYPRPLCTHCSGGPTHTRTILVFLATSASTCQPKDRCVVVTDVDLSHMCSLAPTQALLSSALLVLLVVQVGFSVEVCQKCLMCPSSYLDISGSIADSTLLCNDPVCCIASLDSSLD